MDKKVLESEQIELEKIQKIIEYEIDKLNLVINSREDSIQDTIHYFNGDKRHIDKGEFEHIFNSIYSTDELIDLNKKEMAMYLRILPKPFFAKLTIKDSDNNIKSYYVGLKNIEEKGNSKVIDWRAPLSSLLYFSSLGKTSFTAPIGEVEVELLLKRQFRLEPNKIVSYIDTNTKIDDGILQEILSKNTSSFMTNIVQTIQEEQNKIIRKDARQSVIINGVAGSGKTSIAMHRISYILYTHRGKIKSQNIMVISPNQLFSSYISELLPELGEENVYACTITELYKLLNLAPDSFTNRMEMVESKFSSANRNEEIDIKYSIEFFDKVDDFLINFDLTDYILSSFNLTKINITNSKIQSIKIKPTSELFNRINIIIDYILDYALLISSESKKAKLKERVIKNLKKVLSVQTIMDELYSKFNLHYFNSKLNYEDVAIYAYINAKLFGVDQNYFIKHIFVDEMQDYDPFSLYLLKKIYPDAVMTLAGDYNQNILSKNSNLDMIKRLFPNVSIDNLDVSYRSTYEIMKFAQNLVGKDINTQLIRHGDEIKIFKTESVKDFIEVVNDIVSSHKDEKIAIIAKTMLDAEYLHKYLNDFTIISDELNENLISSNKILTTVYLSKGMEYDRVIIYNADVSNYSSEQDRQNLYVASTRALHGLYLTYNQNLTNFVDRNIYK